MSGPLRLTIGWLFGSGIRLYRHGEARRGRVAAAEAEARAAERARIAREMHDVVTHHVTAMVVQAGAAQCHATDPGKIITHLEAIGETGRHTLAELRDLLGVLDGSRPVARRRPPGLAEITALVDQTRRTGQPVDLQLRGRPSPLDVGLELAAYRVVQEALTNALKYAAARPTRVRLDHRPDGVEITVFTAGRSRVNPVGGSGRGLAGLRERVEIQGGFLRAGPQGAGFLVYAHIPATVRTQVAAGAPQ